MHSTEINGIVFHHNGDFSGDVKIDVPTANMSEFTPAFGEDVQFMVTIPFETLRNLVLEYIRNKTIRNFESMSYGDLEEWAVPGFTSDDSVHECTDNEDHDTYARMMTVDPKTIGINTGFGIHRYGTSEG